jgi:hypothetical protein
MPKFDPITIGASRQKALRDLLALTWGDIEAIEVNDRVLYPHTIYRPRAKGEPEAIQVMLRIPRENETRKARTQAREWAMREKLDPKVDVDLFDNLDTMCILAMCIRNTTPPYEPWIPTPEELERTYERPVLDAVWARLEALRQVVNPRFEDVDDETFSALVLTIAKKASIDPLVVLDSDGLQSFIVRMAQQLQSLLESKSSPASSGS